MRELIKTSLKLLFRNVGFWLCLIVLPILATYILSIHQENLSYYYDGNNDMDVLEIESFNEKVAYYSTDSKYVVKVYDASESKLADYMLTKMVKSGMYKIGRMRIDGMTKEEADERVAYDAMNDRMGAALYINKDFDSLILSGKNSEAVSAYVMSEDERFDLFKGKVEDMIAEITMASTMCGSDDADTILETLDKMTENIPDKKVVSTSGRSGKGLTKEQIDNRTNMGYAFAFMTLCFVLIGNMVAISVIREQSNDVFKRIRLTGKTNINYFVSKIVICVIVSLLIATVLMVCTFFIDSEMLGMSRLTLTGMVFLMGLIFCVMTLLTGAVLGNVMSANIASFTIWCMSSMLSGAYFPISDTAKAVKAISYAMPQKWFIDATEMIYLGDKGAWPMLICVTIAYILIFIGFGSVGIRMRSTED